MRDEPYATFKQWLQAHGATIVPKKRDCEVLRFTHGKATGVIVANKARVYKPNETAARYLQLFEGAAHAPDIGARTSKTARKREARVRELTKRDGGDCFYCGKPIDTELSIEHLVPKCHSGPEHLSNLCLAHKHCNRRAGNQSVVGKVRLREKLQVKRRADHA